MKHEHMAAWKPEEDQMILSLYSAEGRKWAKIASALPGRTSASVRNRFLRIEKGQQLRSQGLSKNRCAACGQHKLGHVCTVKLALCIKGKSEGPFVPTSKPHAYDAGSRCVIATEMDAAPLNMNAPMAYSVSPSISASMPQSLNATRAPTQPQSPTLRVNVAKENDESSDPALSLLSFASSCHDEYRGTYHPSPRASVSAVPAVANVVQAAPVGVAIPASNGAINNNMMINLNFPMQAMPCAFASSLSGHSTPFTSYAPSTLATPRCDATASRCDASTQVEFGEVRTISARPYVPACPEHQLPPIAHASVSHA